MSQKITKKQRLMLNFIEQFIIEHGYSPTFREIASGLGYGSIATVAAHINNLVLGGFLIKTDNTARSLEVVYDQAQIQTLDELRTLIDKHWNNLDEEQKKRAYQAFSDLKIEQILPDSAPDTRQND